MKALFMPFSLSGAITWMAETKTDLNDRPGTQLERVKEERQTAHNTIARAQRSITEMADARKSCGSGDCRSQMLHKVSCLRKLQQQLPTPIDPPQQVCFVAGMPASPSTKEGIEVTAMEKLLLSL